MDFSEYVKQSNKLLLGLMDSIVEKEFDKILDKKKEGRRTEYLVKWHNQNEHEWIPSSHMRTKAEKLAIKEFNQKQ